MARLYVANCTTMNRIFAYRVDFAPGHSVSMGGRYVRAKRITIAGGKQVSVHGDLSEAQMANLVQQLTHQGAIDVSEISTLTARRRPAFLFSMDAAIPKPLIKRVYNHNRGALILEGQERRKTAAVAVHSAVIDRLDPDSGTRIPEDVDAEFIQIDEDDVDVNAGEEVTAGTVAEGVKVQTRGSKPPTPRRRKAA
jgi:hypothetical protein